MSRTLTFFDAAWEAVRSSASRGDRASTLSHVIRLLARPDLPATVAAEAHRLAGELQTEAERYPEARRHFRATAALEPNCARTFYLWGLSEERDPSGSDRQAAKCFRRASALEPENAAYRASFGRAAVRAERPKTGVRELLAATTAAPGDVPVVRIATEGLLEAGRLSAARRVLAGARFLNPTGRANRELIALWERLQFEQARRVQRATTRHRHDAELATDGGRVVLPYVRLVGVESASEGMVRRDVVSLPQPHFPRLLRRNADR